MARHSIEESRARRARTVLRPCANHARPATPYPMASILRLLLRVRARTIALALVALVATAIGVRVLRSTTTVADGATSSIATEADTVLVGRIWIDKLPNRDTDHTEVFVAMSEESVGLFQRSS